MKALLLCALAAVLLSGCIVYEGHDHHRGYYEYDRGYGGRGYPAH